MTMGDKLDPEDNLTIIADPKLGPTGILPAPVQILTESI